jgi:glycosyltransferase involved in cell wall biosynthesis
MTSLTNKNTSRSQKRVGLVLPNTPAYSETFFRNKILGLQQHGYRVILFVNNPKAKREYLNCKTVTAPHLQGKFWVVWWRSFLLLLQAVFIRTRKSVRLYQLNQQDGVGFVENIKSVLSNQFLLGYQLDWLHFGFGTMALGRENIAKVLGAKMAVSFRGFDYYVYPVKNPSCYRILFTKEVRYHVLSEAMKKGLIHQGISSAKVFKITPAIDSRFFSVANRPKSEILQIKTIARLHWIKGLNAILEALAMLKKQNIPFHYAVLGDGEEKERLLFAVHQLGLTEHVSFLGKLPPEAVKKELETTDVYLQYSIQEGFCNAVLEAQAMGLLCIVSNAEGLSENVLDGQTGFVVPKQNPKLLFEKLLEVMHLSESEKETIKKQAVQRVREEFHLEKQQREFLKFYET